MTDMNFQQNSATEVYIFLYVGALSFLMIANILLYFVKVWLQYKLRILRNIPPLQPDVPPKIQYYSSKFYLICV